MKSKVLAIPEIFYVRESSKLIAWENFGAKLKKQTVKLLEMTESIWYFYECLPICEKSAS